MAFSISPSVTTREFDETLFPQEISDATGAVAGTFQWGPVNQPTLITAGEEEVVSRFFRPNDETYLPFFVTADFLSYTNKAWLTRVAGPLASNAVPDSQTPIRVENDEDFQNANLSGYQFLAKYPGSLGSGLTVSLADKSTFSNWEFKNNFDYTPQDGEFAIAVVDGSGRFTGQGATRQLERLVVSGSAKGGIQQVDKIVNTGTAAGGIKQQERLTVFGEATGTTITVAEVDVTVLVGDSQNEVATKIAAALTADAQFETAFATNNQVFVTYADYGTQSAIASVVEAGITVSSAITVSGNSNFSITVYGKTINLINGQSAADVTTRMINVFAADVKTFKNVTNVDATSFTFTYVDYGPKTIVATQTLGGITVATSTTTPGAAAIEINIFGLTVDILHNDSSSAVASKIGAALLADKVAQGIDTVTVDRNLVNYNFPDIGARVAKGIPAPQSNLLFDVDVITPGRSGQILERFELMNEVKGSKFADGTTQYYADAINLKSKYVWVGDESLALAIGNVVLQGGVDDNVGVNPTAAYQVYVNSEEMDLNYLIDTGNAPSVQKAIADIADTRKDCIAFVSPQMTDVVNNKGNEVRDIGEWRTSEVNRETSYLFNDSNWGYVYDKYNDTYRWIPCSGGTAGIKARTDFEAEPWISPAGYEYGRYKNYIKVAWSPNKPQRDELYKIAVNPIVSFKGDGIVLYGDKTSLQRPSAFQGINVRSAFIVAEKTLANFAKYYLFKLNDEFTRAQFSNAVRPFLRGMKARQAFEDFRFVVNESNNGPAIRQAKKMVGNIFIKPLYSINFIELNFTAVGSEISFDEIE